MSVGPIEYAPHAPTTRRVRPAPRGVVTPVPRAFADWVLSYHSIVLLGYALMGKGFAYLGVPPLYVGEILLLGCVAIFFVTRGAFGRLASVPAVLLLCLCAWCGLQTARHVGEYGIDSLRDAALWTYSAIGLGIAAACGERPARLLGLLGRYRRFIPIFLTGAPVAFFLFRFARGPLPFVPGTTVYVIALKEADLLVNLAGVLAFWTAGFARTNTLKIFVLTACAAAMGVIDRAGMVAFGAVFALCLIVRPQGRATAGGLIAIALAVFVLWASDVNIEVPGGKGRTISFSQVVQNVASTLGESNNDGLDSTKEWRMDWWRDIVGYTVHGRYFWTGKGFGPNLADEDGYQVERDHSLRTPHCVHMTFLARAGVPGVTLWALTQASWGLTIAAAFFRARSRGQARWESLFFFLFCYWMAFLINASFDVYLEGPVGGIWFWSVFGVGLAAVDLYRRVPELLEETEAAAEPMQLA